MERLLAVSDDGQGSFVFSRSICGGQFNALVRPDTDQAVIMVQPGLMPPQNFSGPSGEIRRETLAVAAGKIRMIGVEKTRESSSKLGQASVIVAAGRGIGAPENLESIRRFAALFPNSAVAGSRPLIDMGWLEYRYQVGITGATVAPPVYIACGISGSTQHIAGMNGSGYVVSINSDPCAAIFNVSDLCIVDDILGFIDAFERQLDARPDALAVALHLDEEVGIGQPHLVAGGRAVHVGIGGAGDAGHVTALP